MYQRTPLLPTSSSSDSVVDVGLKLGRRSENTGKDFDADSKRKVPVSHRDASQLPFTLSLSRLSSRAVLVLIVVAFTVGLWAARLFGGSSPAAHPVNAPSPPMMSQVQSSGEDWRKKYEELLKSAKDAKSPADAEANAGVKAKEKGKSNDAAYKDSDSEEIKNDAAPSLDDKQVVKEAILNKEKDRQMKELMKQSNDSVAKHKEAEEIPVVGERPGVAPMVLLPASSVWCTGDNLNNRVCKFRNICYNEKYQWFIVRNNASVLSNVPTYKQLSKDARFGLVEISSVQDHPYTAWSYSEVSQFAPEFKNRKVRYFKDFTILFKRFHGSNIMHTLHDDIMPLWHHIRRYVGGTMRGFDHFDFNLQQHRIQFTDDYEVAETIRPFQYLSDMNLGFLSELNDDKELITCFRDATAGVKKLTTWYQYGFSGPQGPIQNKFVNGLHVRMVSDYFVSRLGLPVEDLYSESHDIMLRAGRGEKVPIDAKITGDAAEKKEYVGPDLILILSRTRNRMISNEWQLAEALEKRFKHRTMFVRNEDHSFEEQIALMRRAKVVIGMHGSILIMAMFCRKGTILIEMYPYAVPSDNYTPYRTMAKLHGMHLVYRAWENKHPENSFSHEDWPEALGGIAHLPLEEQKKIKDTPTVPPHQCCVDPYWLFRIYQDTMVDIPEFEGVLVDALNESSTMLENLSKTNILETSSILPPLITGPMFSCVGEGRPKGSLWLRWDEPWNGAKPDHYLVRTRLDKADETVEDPYTYYNTNTTELFVTGFKEGTGVIFSVKSICGDEETAFGDEAICTV